VVGKGEGKGVCGGQRRVVGKGVWWAKACGGQRRVCGGQRQTRGGKQGTNEG
jgi:hypothetical protein